MPSPRKQSAASASTIRANSSTASVSSGEVRFGRMCVNTTRRDLQPTISAASTYGVSLRRQHDPARDPGVDHPAVHRQHDDQRPMLGETSARMISASSRPGNATCTSTPAHHERVAPPAAVAGEQADDDAERAGDEHDDEADDERGASAVEQARQHVLAEAVGAERVVPASRRAA